MRDAEYVLDQGGKVVVSLGGSKCEINCAHCYIFAPGFQYFPSRGPEEIVDRLAEFGDELTTVYLSGDIEPFLEPAKAIEFLSLAADRLDVDLLFTTRLLIDTEWYAPLRDVADRQFAKRRLVVGCVSIPAWQGFRRFERSRRVATPQERVDQLGRFATELRIPTMLAARPTFPAELVPLSEYRRLLEAAAQHSTVILGEALFLDTDGVIERRLRTSIDNEFTIGRMSFFDQNRDWKIVHAESQIAGLRRICEELDKPFYLRSMPGVELIRDHWDRDSGELAVERVYPLPVPDFG
ncbi:hypothetical protein ITP53_06130 [Nonomuraea sp. K274]|uniref:Radical SAM protein n=1 Tax=Nonomuraea cypriaca TaxID=1187855 RepID=A0A931A8G9_9ACTN|nr:hypothetical protein [Nonomuraea cypriaca]MBF8185320.1 hypothetical protein [Nonomuraea cypriaca]